MTEQALAAAGRDWRVAYMSQSMVGLGPVVQAGLAIVVVTRSMLTPQLRALDESSGLPPLHPWNWPCIGRHGDPPSRHVVWPN